MEKQIHLLPTCFISVGLFSFISSTVFLGCCSNEEPMIPNTETSASSNDSVINLLPSELYLTMYGTRADENNHFREPHYSDGINIGIVSFGLHTKRSGCLKGFGICDVDWWPWFNGSDPKDKIDQNLRNLCYSPLTRDGRGNLCFYLLLNDSASISNALVTRLAVEEDITGYYTDSVFSQSITVVQGDYVYDSNLGQYGGYKVYVDLQD